MNDEQRAKMMSELAAIFDDAARTCSHSSQAALKIEQRLRAKGFAIVLLAKAERAMANKAIRAKAVK